MKNITVEEILESPYQCEDELENREWELTVEGRYAAQCLLSMLKFHLYRLLGDGKSDVELELEIKNLEDYLENHNEVGR